MPKPSQSVRSKNGPLQFADPLPDGAARAPGSSGGLAESFVAAKNIHTIDTGDARFVYRRGNLFWPNSGRGAKGTTSSEVADCFWTKKELKETNSRQWAL